MVLQDEQPATPETGHSCRIAAEPKSTLVPSDKKALKRLDELFDGFARLVDWRESSGASP